MCEARTEVRAIQVPDQELAELEGALTGLSPAAV
jgi:hypothetical protein